MTRLHTIAPADAVGPAATLFGAIKQAIGMVPNAYATAGSNSPVALKASLGLDAALRETSLSTKQVEIIKLAVSETVGCDYCVAAHTLMGKKAGLSRDSILAIRRGADSDDAATDALADFARLLVTTTGTVPLEEVEAIKAAGYSDAQIVDTMLAIASITFTNLLNRVNDTTLDFPAAD
ncbi:carboxymuconolactone decarboxylase family protein [Telluria aromaticivorans]|uniref:Carboxymuconolactone decarboxylase family protein n=1 Tax=Telluria aromaticivorans TaxID=2725995 RepID=A0A7Y2NXE5_9BURK|nr:carboxymuconolactone decarboxylase family protein [Telluria aromaticivorans]NNG21642.1 carboxymuconolactone decarboxylase family protein [Telluria aromaticivorans]